MELNDFLARLKSSDNPDKYGYLVNPLERLSSLCYHLTLLAPQYDWKTLPSNGFRSIIRLCNLFTVNVLERKYSTLNYDERQSIVGVIKLLIVISERAIDYHREGQKLDESCTTITKDYNKVKTLRDLKQHFDSIEPHLKSYWGHHGLFWMTSDSRWVPYCFSLIYSLVHSFPKSLLALISRDEYANIMTFSTWKSTLFFPINLANYCNNFISQTYSLFRFRMSGVEYRQLNIPRQSNWIINDDGSQFTSPPTENYTRSSTPRDGQTINCHLIKCKSNETSGDVIIHAQGGGFVVDARQLHEEYLRDWVKQLDGAVIINIVYSRFVRYPFALQEILDVYLWLTSNRETVDKTLGFKPKRIICLGDSAGSYLLFSMCLILRDIQLISPEEIKIFPKALVALSPILSSTTSKVLPSLLLSYIDPFLCPSLILNCFSLYGSGVIYESDCFNLEKVNEDQSMTTTTTNNNNNINWPTWLKDKYSMSTPSYKNVYNTWINKGKSWFDCDNVTFENRINQMALRMTIPYISPLISYNLEKINDLELYLISTEFDPLLDTNIELARKWEGKLTFDVIGQMAHGFTAYYSLSNTCYQASKLCLQRLKESISSSSSSSSSTSTSNPTI